MSKKFSIALCVFGLIFLFNSFFIGESYGAGDENVGDEMGSFKNVVAYSNGVYTADPYATLEQAPYQCVEYVKRFYKEAMGVNLYKRINVARNYYEMYDNSNYPEYAYLKNSGLVRYQNGQSNI